MHSDDRDYYLRRASEEDAAARAAASLSARWRHEELAGLYRMRASLLGSTNAAADVSVESPFILRSVPPEIEAA